MLVGKRGGADEPISQCPVLSALVDIVQSLSRMVDFLSSRDLVPLGSRVSVGALRLFQYSGELSTITSCSLLRNEGGIVPKSQSARTLGEPSKAYSPMTSLLTARTGTEHQSRRGGQLEPKLLCPRFCTSTAPKLAWAFFSVQNKRT